MEFGTGDSDSHVYTAFAKISQLARQLNISVPTPELLLLGKEGHGKSSLINAFLSFEIAPLAEGKHRGTRRPIFYNIINDPAATKPKVTIKRDLITKHPDDLVVPVEEASAALADYNVESLDPLNVNIEFDKCWSVTLIDTPGLDEKNKELEDLILEFAKSPHRLIVAVEEAGDWEQCMMMRFTRQVDPKADRSRFVYTKFNDLVRSFQGTRELNSYLTKATPEGKFFFVSLGQPDNLEKLFSADMDLLEQMQYDLRYERNVGAPTLRQHLVDWTWRKYQEFIPEILKSLRSFKTQSDDNFRKIQIQIGSMDSYKLRAIANQYVMDFLQAIEKLAVGTLEGNPAQNGQTLAEEKDAHNGAWLDADFKPIEFEPSKWNIRGWDSKLYGGQQIERLLNEFHTLVRHIEMPEAPVDDVATAAGPHRLSLASNYAWTASDIAQKASNRAFKALIEQLFSRAVYVMERQIGIVDKMLETKRKMGARKQSRQGAGVPDAGGPPGFVRPSGGGADPSVPDALSNIDDFPYFTNAVKDFYLTFIHQTAAVCKQKCLDEFYCTQLIYWEAKWNDADIALKHPDDPKAVAAAVNSLARRLFDTIKERIASNVMLKCHNHFLVPISEQLWGEIQRKITCLSDNEMETLFEVQITREKLKNDERQLAEVSSRFSSMEVSFQKAADVFSRHSFSRVSFAIR